MASMVPNNPFDVQPEQSGIVSAAMAPGMSAAQTYQAQTREVDRPTETAAGQVESLLATDSPLMQRARTLAMQNMNQRGLVNSSMSQGAGVAAMVDRVTPIALQDAQTYSNRALVNQNAVNEASQFNAGERNRFGLQRGEQDFTAAENQRARTFQSGEAALARDFQSREAVLDRTQQANIAAFQAEAARNMQTAQQQFQAAQAELQRAQDRQSQERSIAGQADLTLAQQRFAAAQAELDRQVSREQQERSIAGQADLAAFQQRFQATQAQLDRENQAALVTLQNSLNNANVSRAFAANIAGSTLSSIGVIQADPNLTPDAKIAAVRNLIDAANSTMAWGSTFYGTSMPNIREPGANTAAAAATTQTANTTATTQAANTATAQNANAAAAPRFTNDQYQAAGQWIAANLNNPGLIASTASQLGLTTEDVARAAQTVNPNITTAGVEQWLAANNVGLASQAAFDPSPGP